MLQLKYRDWTAVRISDEASVAHLNELFASGWFLMDLDLGELKCLAFSVPVTPLTRDERRMIAMPASRRTPTFVVVIVSRGKSGRRQHAIFRAPGAPMIMPPGSRRNWRPFYAIPVESGGVATVYERVPEPTAEQG